MCTDVNAHTEKYKSKHTSLFTTLDPPHPPSPALFPMGRREGEGGSRVVRPFQKVCGTNDKKYSEAEREEEKEERKNYDDENHINEDDGDNDDNEEEDNDYK